MIRHSALPKLAQCPCYESNPVAGPAAERGTKMDAAFRAFLMGKPVTGDLTTEELEAVMWAVDTARDIADGAEIEADEVNLKVNTPGLDHIGTEDARCESEAISFDLKTGQIRSYYEQAAAYALGNMERTFEENWTFVLLFCDQREFTRLEFNHAQASAVVADVVASASDPNRKPTSCDYCSWCRKADTCVARTAPVVETLAVVEEPEMSLEALKSEIVSDPARLGLFLQKAAQFVDFYDEVKTAAKVDMEAGVNVPGWKLQKQAGNEYFDRLSIVRAAVAGKSGLDELVDLCGGKASGKRFREWCAKMGIAVQEEESRRGAEIVKLVVDKPKKGKSK
jgi:hypothetical protein